MVLGGNWQPTCRLMKQLPEAPTDVSLRENIADIEISNERDILCVKQD